MDSDPEHIPSGKSSRLNASFGSQKQWDAEGLSPIPSPPIVEPSTYGGGSSLIVEETEARTAPPETAKSVLSGTTTSLPTEELDTPAEEELEQAEEKQTSLVESIGEDILTEEGENLRQLAVTFLKSSLSNEKTCIFSFLFLA